MKGTAARTNAIMARSVPLPPPQSPHGNITRRLAAVALPVKAAKVLEVLLEAEGAPVTRDALIDRVWGDEPVSDAALTQAVYLIRRALAEAGLASALTTLPKRGYRLCIPAAAPERLPPELRRSVAFAFALAFAVAALLSIGSAMKPKVSASTLHGEAARLYAIARFRWSTRSHDGVLAARTLFDRVIRLAPRSSLGYAGVADAELAMHDYWCTTGVECRGHLERARAAAVTALRLDPASPAALTSAAQVAHVRDADDARAEVLFRRAIALDPTDALAFEWLGNMEIMQGRLADGARHLRTATALDPVAPATYAWLAHAAYFRHDFRAAVFYAREALGLAPNRGESRALLGVALARAGDTRDARNVFATLSRFGGDAVQAHLLALPLPGARGDPPFVRGLHARDAALVWLARGDHGRALAEMRVAAFADSTERRFFAMDPALDPVRADARFRRWTTGA
jgi:Flp pilus assembly protein TadD